MSYHILVKLWVVADGLSAAYLQLASLMDIRLLDPTVLIHLHIELPSIRWATIKAQRNADITTLPLNPLMRHGSPRRSWPIGNSQ